MKTSLKRRTWGFREIKQQFIEGNNKVLLVAWATAIFLIFLINSFMQTSRISFLGIADSYEHSINFEYPVEIKKIHVVAGQIVNKGELLVELDQKEIDFRLRELESLITRLEIEKGLRSEIQNLMVESEGASRKNKDTLSYDIESYKKELAVVKKQKQSLFVYSEDSGIIGAVNFKSGQQVPPFMTLISILSHKPGMIKAYIHENIHTQAEIGQEVSLWSVAHKDKKFSGSVMSVGSRIVEMPLRLTNSPANIIWGREVIVRLNNDNTFLMGEKVVIATKSFWDFLTPSQVFTRTISDNAKPDTDITIDTTKL